MPEYISRQILRRKALDRWENEGGSICADQPGIIKNKSPRERAGKDDTAQTFERPTADEAKRRKNKSGDI
jgi:hypothetical protein